MGLTDAELVKPSVSTNINNPVEDLRCTICLSSEFAQECRINGCNHSFCFSCISEWVCQSLRPSCPMCRQDVDKVSYDFSENGSGKKQITIKEYRSGHMSLTQSDRAQLLSERRLVVRNMMHAYKVVGLLTSEISGIMESKEPNKIMKNALIELTAIVTQHIQKAEILLSELRTENTRKNKSLVFNTLTFRRMIYTNKIKVKYTDTKRPKLQPSDIAKEPDRFRSIITNFLVAEFDAIPFQHQPKLAGLKWRTLFLGSSIDLTQKQRYAAQIFDLMLVSPAGNEYFQRELNEILAPVSNSHIQFLDDHLEAIVAIEKTKIEDFYNEVYYDSIYNSFSNNFFDYNSAMRDDPQSRFEALFHQIHRDIGPTNWMDPYMSNRLIRQSSNTDGTDRATNNDDDSDRSVSPEERVPTPIPDYDSRDQNMTRVYYEQMLDPPPNRSPLSIRTFHMLHGRERPRFEIDLVDRSGGVGQTSRTMPITQNQPSISRSHMTLRSSVRRDRENPPVSEGTTIPPAENRPQTRREIERDALLQRVRNLDDSSYRLSNIIRSQTSSSEPLNRRFAGVYIPALMSLAPRFPTATSSTTNIPIYQPSTSLSNDDLTNPSRPRLGYMERRRMQAADSEHLQSVESIFTRVTQHAVQTVQRTINEIAPAVHHSISPPPLPRPPTPHNLVNDEESIQRIADAINQEDADNGLDFISVAHRTRSARRAAQNGEAPDAPPAKRNTNSRRDRN